MVIDSFITHQIIILMRKVFLLLAFLGLGFWGLGQTTICNITFESSGGYSTSVAEFTDGSYNFFTRTNGSNIGSNYFVSNIQGSYYFAGEDIDEGASLPVSLTIDDVNISGYSSLQLKVYLAEDDDGSNQDWDGTDYVHFDYDIDNTGSFSNLLWVEGANSSNTEPKIDTDFNGQGDGTAITSTFAQFTANITGTGSLLDIKITFNLDSGDEDIAIDNIEIVGISSGPDDPDILTATTQSTTEILAEWLKNSSSDNVMLAWSSDGVFGTPVNGTTYSASDVISGGGTVLYNGASTSYSHTGLTPGTTYYYKAWSVDGSTDYSTGITDDATTFEPTITLSPTSLTGFSYTVDAGPSAEQTFTAEGSHLSANISIIPPSDYEISTATGGSFVATNPVILTQSSGTVGSTTIYVRLKEGLSVGSYNSEDITASSTDATNKTVSCSGTVNPIDDPSTFTATTASTSQIDLAWTQNGNGDNVMIAWNSSNTFGNPTGSYVVGNTITGGGTVIVNGSGTSYSHTGLTAGTHYYYKAWSRDASNNYSTGLTADAATLSNPITSFPWTEDFEHSGSAPVGWTQEYVSAAVDWIYMAGGLDGNPASAHGGSYNATFYSENYNSDETKLVTVPLDLSGLTAPILSFWHTQADYGGDIDELKVYYKTSASGSWTLIPGQTYTSSIASWTEESAIALPNPSAEYYIAFDALSGYGYGVCIDDISVKEAPVPPPTSLNIDYTASDKMELTWTAPSGTYDKVLVFGRSGAAVDHNPSGAGTSYNDANAAWGSAGAYDNSVLLYAGTGTTVTVTGLTDGTDYYYKAYAYDDSNWSDGTSDINDIAEVQGTSGFAAAAGNTQAGLSWTNYTGAQGTWWDEVLVLAHEGSAVDASPSGDGTSYTANAAFGSGTQVGTGNYVVYQGTGTSETITALTNGTTYYFRIFGRYGSDWTDIDEWESASCMPSSLFEPTPGDLVINEVNDHATTGAEFTEIYNTTANEINLVKVDLDYYNNGSSSATTTKHLTGTIAANSYIVIARDEDVFNTEFGFYPDFEYADMFNNGDNDGMLIRHDDNGIIDQFNDVPNATGNWGGGNLLCRFDYDSDGSDLDADWDNSGHNYTGTPKAKNELTWQTSGTSDWSTASNWHNGDLPSKAVSVVIPSGGTQPLAEGTTSSPLQCYDLSINSGAILTIKAGGCLTVNSTLTNNAGNTGLVLKSDATGPSSLIHNTNGVAATMESYFADLLDAWYLVSPPMSDAVAGVFMGEHLDYWNEPTGHWVSIVDENTHLNTGQGYSVEKAVGNTNTYTGTLNNGDVTISGLSRSSGTTYAGWNLVGNPYPSVLSVDDMSFTDIGAAVSVWPHTGSNSSSYISYSKGSGGASEARYIQPGQGFMVQVSSGSTSADLTFTNAMRTHTGLALFDKSAKEPNNNQESLKIMIQGEETTKDETYIGFREGASINFDPYYDVHKLFGAAANPHIFSYINIEEGEKAAIQSFPQPAEGDVVHLGTRIGVTGEYELRFSGLSTFAADQAFLLLDKKMNKLYEIRADSVITFSYENGDSENRFDLIFDMTTDINNDALITQDFNVFICQDRLYLSDEKMFGKNAILQVYDLLGQKLIERRIAGDNRGILLHLSSSYYVLRIQSNHRLYSKKFFIP
jgi:hypothetical protein